MSDSKSYFYKFIPINLEISQHERDEILEKYPPPELPTSEEFFNIQNVAAGNIVKIRVLLNDFSIQM